MVKVLLIADEADSMMGAYFSACAADIKGRFNGQKIDLNEIQSKNLNTAFLDLAIDKLNGDRFVCVVYSHGTKTSFVSKESFIVMEGTGKFNNSLFYTFSCHTGKEIGIELVKKGCVSFLGYTSEASFIVTYVDTFVECANHGLAQMLDGKSSGDAFDLMKDNYDEKSYAFYKTDYFVAAQLMSNKAAMILHGDRKSRIEDFLTA